jgi:hypothetical protein
VVATPGVVPTPGAVTTEVTSWMDVGGVDCTITTGVVVVALVVGCCAPPLFPLLVVAGLFPPPLFPPLLPPLPGVVVVAGGGATVVGVVVGSPPPTPPPPPPPALVGLDTGGVVAGDPAPPPPVGSPPADVAGEPPWEAIIVNYFFNVFDEQKRTNEMELERKDAPRQCALRKAARVGYSRGEAPNELYDADQRSMEQMMRNSKGLNQGK